MSLSFSKQRELPTSAFASFHRWLFKSEVKDISKVKQATCYAVLGIDSRKVKKTFSVFCSFFGNENKADWMKVFEDLITRGLKEILIVITDSFPGIIDAVKLAYPLADLELVFVHLQRNVRKHMTKEDASAFNKSLDKLRISSSDFDEAVT
jgi:transposase-like protein